MVLSTRTTIGTVTLRLIARRPPPRVGQALGRCPGCRSRSGHRTRDRLSALKELLRLEPAASEELELGSLWHVYPDRIVRGEAGEAPGGEHGDGLGTP